MKQLFLILTLSISLTSVAQVRRDSLPPLTDSTALITVKDVAEFDAILQQKFSIRELGTYQELLKWWQERIALRARTYQSPQSKSTPK